MRKLGLWTAVALGAAGLGGVALYTQPSSPVAQATSPGGERSVDVGDHTRTAATDPTGPTTDQASGQAQPRPIPKFTKEATMEKPGSSPTDVPDKLIATVEKVRSTKIAAFEKAAELTGAQKEQLTVVIEDMNKTMAAAFEKYVAEALRTGQPLPDEHRDKYLVEFGEAIEKADAEVAKINPKARVAAAQSGFMAGMMADPENTHRTAIFHNKFVVGSALDPSRTRSKSSTATNN